MIGSNNSIDRGTIFPCGTCTSRFVGIISEDIGRKDEGMTQIIALIVLHTLSVALEETVS